MLFRSGALFTEFAFTLAGSIFGAVAALYAWAFIVIKLDAINPQVAARLARSLDRWRRYAPALQAKMKRALEKVAARAKLSNDVLEVVTKALAD